MVNNKYIFAIGDIHGHFQELYNLMSKLIDEGGLEPKRDTVVFLGDYVDRGPNTKGVIDFLMDWQKKYPHHRCLYGNHEDLMLDALGSGKIYQSWHLWWQQGGRETAYSYYPKGHSAYEYGIMKPEDFIPKKHIAWLNRRLLLYTESDYVFVHGGLIPGMSIKDHKQAIKNGDESLRQNLIWIRDQFLDSNYDWGKTVIFGHTAIPPKFEVIRKHKKIGIDTGIGAKTGRLTAIRLPDEKIFSVNTI